MAQPIVLKRSSVASKVPLTTDLQLGELAINTYDGKLYIKKNNGTESVVEVGASAGGGLNGFTTSSGTGWASLETNNGDPCGITIAAKGATGGISFGSNVGGVYYGMMGMYFDSTPTSGTQNGINFFATNTGNAPYLFSDGADANVDFAIHTKGDGKLIVNAPLVLSGVDTGIVLAGITTEPAAPAAGTGRMYAKSIANRMMPKWIGPSGFDYPLQSSIGHNRIQQWQAGGGSTTITALGATALTTAGTVTAKSTAVTNIYTAIQSTEWLVTTAATTAVASFRHATAQYRVGTNNVSLPGGFYFSCRWGPATGVATTTHRAFCGMGSSAAPTDVQPSTLTNSVGMGWDSADTNIQIMHGSTGASTKIDLGASFPVPTADRTKMYELVLFSPMSTTQSVGYRVTDLGTGAQVSGLITTNMPSNTTYLAPRAYCSVGGTSSVVGIALSSLYIETDF